MKVLEQWNKGVLRMPTLEKNYQWNVINQLNCTLCVIKPTIVMVSK